MHENIELHRLKSNKDIDWAKQYDFYEIEYRSMYKSVCRPQNESHFMMLRRRGKKYINKDSAFCEIGFGAGVTLRYALKYFNKVYGLDISPKNVDYTIKELENEGYLDFNLYTCDILKLDKRFINKFDIISFIHGLEHFTSDDYPVILENIKRYLKPEGIFSGALPYKNRLNFRKCPQCGYVFEYDGHVSSHDIESLHKVFQENRFEIIHLDNYNIQYALKHSHPVKKIYRCIAYYIFNRHPNNQLEFIVKPIN